MEALKKAYAEMILNTAKEAAAQTMASERKALRLQNELSNTKDEALRMLFRLKNMLDVKTTEAETTSLGQKKRIDELDAQLNKTEDVIVDLRSEISKAREQLEQVKNSHMLQSNGPTEKKHVDQEKTAHTKKLDVTEQFRCDKNSNPGKETVRSGPHSDNVLDSDTDLMSIDIGSKEFELYRNGYTHRIRAIERNLVDGKSFSEDKPYEDINTRKKLFINVDKDKRGQCAPSSMVADNTDAHTDTKYVNLSEALSINSSVAKDETITTKRLEVNSCGKDERLTESSKQSECPLRRSIRKRKVRCWDEISSLFKSRSALRRCKKYSDNDRVKIETHQHRSKSLSPSTGASKEITYDVKDTKLLSESVVKKQELAAKESAVVTCDTNENSSLKYTFSRRRKKVLSLETDDLTCQMKEKPSSSPDNENRNLIEDTSSDIHNMVDITCQLVSLSGSRTL
nr:uncharacterized protein [Tanacetum cinerariifolium]